MMRHVVLDRAVVSCDQFVKRPATAKHSGRHSDDWSQRIWGSISKSIQDQVATETTKIWLRWHISYTIAGKLRPVGWHNHITIFSRAKVGMGSDKSVGVFENSAPSITLIKAAIMIQYIYNTYNRLNEL